MLVPYGTLSSEHITDEGKKGKGKKKRKAEELEKTRDGTLHRPWDARPHRADVNRHRLATVR